ncbi:hypothetical protein MMC11_006891 [Xylographa trunciseda]|nr:hypothetical protein [Xylographa trunciseda]
MPSRRNKLISGPKTKAKKGPKRVATAPRPKISIFLPPPPPPPPSKPPPAFTISWNVFFNKQSVWGFSKVSNKFDFRAWDAEQNKKISDYSAQKGLRLIRYKGSALVTCAGNSKNQELDFNDDSDWEAAADLAYLWGEEKRKNISVLIEVYYGNKPLKDGEDFDPTPKAAQEALVVKKRGPKIEAIQLSSDDDDQEASAGADSDDNGPKKKKIKKESKARASATSRQLKKIRERQEID